MSLILDALRRGRARQTPRPPQNTAQTDAVLHTLGYGRFSPASPFNRLKRFAAYLAVGAVMALVIWGAVVWITEKYLTPRRQASFEQNGTRNDSVDVVRPPQSQLPAAQPEPRYVPPPPAAAPPVLTPPASRGDAPVDARARLSGADGPVVPPAPPRTARATLPSSEPELAPPQRVSASRRPDVPASAPVPPVGAPSNTPIAGSVRAPAVIASNDHLRRAIYYHQIGDFENALLEYRTVLARDELNAEAHNNLGLLYRDKNLTSEAEREFQRAIAINPRYVKAHNNLGVTYLSQRKLDAASAQLRTALKLDPKNVESLVNLALVEKDAGRRDEARAGLERALEIDAQNAEAHYNLGILEDESGSRDRALVHYKAFLQHGAVAHADLMAAVRRRIDALSR